MTKANFSIVALEKTESKQNTPNCTSIVGGFSLLIIMSSFLFCTLPNKSFSVLLPLKFFSLKFSFETEEPIFLAKPF